MADYSEQTASATNEAENTGVEHNTSESSKSILYPVDRLVSDNNIAPSTDADDTDNSNLVLRCQFCKRHVQCIDDKITTLHIYGESSQPDHPHHAIQALNCSRCNHKTIGVKLCQRWWQLDEALKTATPRADGFYPVSASLNDHVGVLCTWSIPVLDSLYIRKEYRGREHGLQVLQDYLAMYDEGPIGIAQPCSKPFIKVCHNYLKKHPEDRSRLWLCTPPGDEDNRVSLWRHSKKVIKQSEKNSATPTTSSTTSPQMSSLVSPPSTSSFPTTSLLETLASVSESRRLAEDAEANATNVVDSGVSEGVKSDATSGGDGNVQSRRQEDVGDGVSSASSCQNNCKDEHQLGVRCQGCMVKSPGHQNECFNGQSENNLAFGAKDGSCHADSSEALANFSEESGRREESYQKTEERMDIEMQNIASSSSVLYETDDAHMTLHEAETTAMDLSAKRPKVVDKEAQQNSSEKSNGDARKREVDSSIISADDDRSVGGGHSNCAADGDSSKVSPDQQLPVGNGDLLKKPFTQTKSDLTTGWCRACSY
ncbi:uncharacterized protein [Amphiura filiformis]|uniref:uncharacterized protein n=1 Tax=Amphiura filiformis TaxID=82378 RepID=UPI003B21C0FD